MLFPTGCLCRVLYQLVGKFNCFKGERYAKNLRKDLVKKIILFNVVSNFILHFCTRIFHKKQVSQEIYENLERLMSFNSADDITRGFSRADKESGMLGEVKCLTDLHLASRSFRHLSTSIYRKLSDLSITFFLSFVSNDNYRPSTKLKEGNVFTGVCNSVGGGEILHAPLHFLGYHPPWDIHLWDTHPLHC